MRFYYNQQRARILREYDGRCAGCDRVLSDHTGFETHHLLIPKGQIRNRHRADDMDYWINLVPLCLDCHREAHTTRGKELLCQSQYELLGRGDPEIGYDIAYSWCKTILKSEPDIPKPWRNDS